METDGRDLYLCVVLKAVGASASPSTFFFLVNTYGGSGKCLGYGSIVH